jgi:hypothetical protein
VSLCVFGAPSVGVLNAGETKEPRIILSFWWSKLYHGVAFLKKKPSVIKMLFFVSSAEQGHKK